MIRCSNPNWFAEEYGFFGDFYYISDNSTEGPFNTGKKSRAQRTDDEVNMVIDFLGINSDDNIFDCPCGWGRHAISLAEKGINVTAIDINKKYLSIFKESIQGMDDCIKSRLSLLNCDMRHVNLNKKHNAGINMFSSFGFFDDKENLSVAKNFCNLLKNNGKMLFYFDFNPDRLEKHFQDDYMPSRSINHNGKDYHLEVKKEYHTDDKRLHGRWTLIDNDGVQIEKEYSFRIYNKQDITSLLKEAGFDRVDVLSKKGNELSINDIETVVIAQK